MTRPTDPAAAAILDAKLAAETARAHVYDLEARAEQRRFLRLPARTAKETLAYRNRDYQATHRIRAARAEARAAWAYYLALSRAAAPVDISALL